MSGKTSAYVLTVSSQKGGSSKTSTVAALGACLAEDGFDVVLVDGDVQADMTVSFGFDSTGLPLERTLGGVLYNTLERIDGPGIGDIAVDITDEVFPRPPKGRLRLVAANRELARVVKLLEADQFGLTVMSDALSGLDCDVCIIDTPPTLGTHVLGALAAADGVLTPVAPDVRAFAGAERIWEEVDRLAAHGYGNPEPVGVFLTQLDPRTKLGRDAEKYMHTFKGKVPILEATRRTVRVSEAALEGKPITIYDPDHQVSQAYRSIAREVAKHVRRKRNARAA